MITNRFNFPVHIYAPSKLYPFVSLSIGPFLCEPSFQKWFEVPNKAAAYGFRVSMDLASIELRDIFVDPCPMSFPFARKAPALFTYGLSAVVVGVAV